MNITAAMLVHLLRLEQGIELALDGDPACVIRRIRTWQHGAHEEATLYVPDIGRSGADDTTRTSDAPHISNDPRDKLDWAFATAIPPVPAEQLTQVLYDAMEKLRDMDAQLKDALIENASMQQVVTIAESLFSTPFVLVDKDLIVLAVTSNYADTVKHYEALLGDDAKATLPADVVRARRRRGYTADDIQIPASTVDELLDDPDYYRVGTVDGEFFYSMEEGVGQAFGINQLNESGNWELRLIFFPKRSRTIADIGEEQLARWLFGYLVEAYHLYTGTSDSSRSQTDPLHQAIRALLIEGRNLPARELSSALASYAWEPNHEYTVVKFTFFEGSVRESASSYLCRQLERQWRNSVAVAAGHTIVWVFNHSLLAVKHKDGNFIASAAQMMSENACRGGISDPFVGFNGLRNGYYEAEMALELGRRRDPHFWFFRFGDYRLDYLVSHGIDHLGFEQVCHPGLLAVMRHDEREGTSLAPTLRAYLESGRNASRTAEKLYLHRTSLIRRLDHAEKIGSFDLSDTDTTFYLLFSFKLEDADSLRSPEPLPGEPR